MHPRAEEEERGPNRRNRRERTYVSERHIRPSSRRFRLGHSALALLFWFNFLNAIARVVTADAPLGPALLWAIPWGILAIYITPDVIQNWRGGVIVSDDGITVDNGLGRTRHLRWEQVAGVTPPHRGRGKATINVEDAPDVVLGGWSPTAWPALGPDQFTELEDLISQRVE